MPEHMLDAWAVPNAARYRFRTVWTVPAAPGAAYEVLHDLREYPRWWPQVKEVRRAGEDAAEVVVRSVLPYYLRFLTRRTRTNPTEGILQVAMTGDLEGFSRWTILGGPSFSRLIFEEDVVTNKPLLNRLAIVARPAFKANHAWMMRDGEAGLRTYLAGFLRGQAS